jgi:hypothetical protein
MSSITKSQAEIDAQIAHDALVAAANARFIAAADIQITEAIARGVFFANCETFETDIDPKLIYDYYAALGYKISFPDLPLHDLSQQPAQLFGEFWINFWNNGLVPKNMKHPIRIIFAWD